jgi:hypothetical protein
MSAAPNTTPPDPQAERKRLARVISNGLCDLIREVGSKRAAAAAMGVSVPWLTDIERGWVWGKQFHKLERAAEVAEAARVRRVHFRECAVLAEYAADRRERESAVAAGVATGKVLRFRPRTAMRACPKPRGAA